MSTHFVNLHLFFLIPSFSFSFLSPSLEHVSINCLFYLFLFFFISFDKSFLFRSFQVLTLSSFDLLCLLQFIFLVNYCLNTFFYFTSVFSFCVFSFFTSAYFFNYLHRLILLLLFLVCLFKRELGSLSFFRHYAFILDLFFR